MVLDETNCLVVKSSFNEKLTRRVFFRDASGSYRMIFLVGDRVFKPSYSVPDQEDYKKGNFFLRDIVSQKLNIKFC
jgi:hypothetical protein